MVSNSVRDNMKVNFDPRDNDVICTKLRQFNTKHPGNVRLSQLVIEKAPHLNVDKDFKSAAEEIVDIIARLGGRFLKLNDKDCQDSRNIKVCSIMNRKQCFHRVVRSLRTAHSRLHGTTTPRRPSKRKVRKSKKKYEAKAGDKPIYPYALDLISLVCNHLGNNAFRVLDTPVGDFTAESEPEKERLMRLQIRQRYASAKAVNMSPLEFSKKLMQLWGGSLVLAEEPKKRDTPPRSLKVPQPQTGDRVYDISTPETAFNSANAKQKKDEKFILFDTASAKQLKTTIGNYKKALGSTKERSKKTGPSCKVLEVEVAPLAAPGNDMKVLDPQSIASSLTLVQTPVPTQPQYSAEKPQKKDGTDWEQPVSELSASVAPSESSMDARRREIARYIPDFSLT